MKKCNITLNKNGKLLPFFINNTNTWYYIVSLLLSTSQTLPSRHSDPLLPSLPSLLPPPTALLLPFITDTVFSVVERLYFFNFPCTLFPGMLLKLWYPKVPGIVLALLNQSTKTFISSSSMNSEETNSTSICLNLFFTKVKKSVAVWIWLSSGHRKLSRAASLLAHPAIPLA